jgi:hypothetical protein
MFNAITWGQYTGVLFLLLLAYYAYVGLAYYRVELLWLLKNKGKAPVTAPAPGVAPAAPGPKRSLLVKAALALPTAPSTTTKPAAPAEEAQQEEKEAGQEMLLEAAYQEEQPADERLEPVADLPPFELSTAQVNEMNNYENNEEFSFDIEYSINFTEQGDFNTVQDAESGMESANDDFELGSTIGIAQLSDYLGRAAEGQVTPEQLVEQEPSLANTDLLLAFFQTSTKNAQWATAHLYEGIAEPVLD